MFMHRALVCTYMHSLLRFLHCNVACCGVSWCHAGTEWFAVLARLCLQSTESFSCPAIRPRVCVIVLAF